MNEIDGELKKVFVNNYVGKKKSFEIIEEGTEKKSETDEKKLQM